MVEPKVEPAVEPEAKGEPMVDPGYLMTALKDEVNAGSLNHNTPYYENTYYDGSTAEDYGAKNIYTGEIDSKDFTEGDVNEEVSNGVDSNLMNKLQGEKFDENLEVDDITLMEELEKDTSLC